MRRTRPRAVSALASVVAIGALLLGATPVAASDDDESRSPEPSPMEALGADGLTEIRGGDTRDDSPDLEPGAYVDIAPNPDTYRAYRITRDDPDTTLQIGITTLGRTYSLGQLDVGLLTFDPDDPEADGTPCASSLRAIPEQRTQMPLGTLALVSTDENPLCAAATEFYLVVSNSSLQRNVTDRPILTPGTPYSILFRELPAFERAGSGIADDSSAPDPLFYPYQDASDPTAQVQPGDSMTTAAPLESGTTTRVDVTPGEIAWLAVPLEFGQNLNVVASVADGAPVAGAFAEMRIVGPVGGFADGSSDRGEPTSPRSLTLAGGENLLSNYGSTIDPQSRSASGSLDLTRYLAPGYYYVALFVQDLNGSGVSSIPVNLNALVQERQTYPGDDFVPASYDGSPTELFTPSGAAPTDYTEPTLSDREQSSGRTTLDWVLIGGLLVLSIGSALVGVLILRRRPARPGSAAGPAAPGRRRALRDDA